MASMVGKGALRPAAALATPTPAVTAWRLPSDRAATAPWTGRHAVSARSPANGRLWDAGGRENIRLSSPTAGGRRKAPRPLHERAAHNPRAAAQSPRAASRLSSPLECRYMEAGIGQVYSVAFDSPSC
ncbi:uncharacterized protein LOC114604992 [Podarcis muralis]